MNKEDIDELLEYNNEYMEAQISEEIFGGDYTSAVELEYVKKENQRLQQELERYKNIIKNIKEEIELYIDITIDHFETSNEEINFELRNKCRAMREIKSEILEIIEKELKGSDN